MVKVPGTAEGMEAIETLIAEGEAEDPASADAWIAGLRASNASYHNERLGTYRKKVRDADVRGGKVLGSLAASAREFRSESLLICYKAQAGDERSMRRHGGAV